MTIRLKLSTASQEVPIGPFLDSTDGNTEKTALTIANTDIKIWKNGASTLVSKNSGGATHIANGIYYATLDATDTNTAGPMVIYVHMAGALFVKLETEVLPAQIYDSMIAGTDTLETDNTLWLGSAIATPTVTGVPEVDITHIEGTAHGSTYVRANALQWAGAATASDDVALATAPANFADLAITATTGRVTAGTVSDKTGYSLSGTKTTLDMLNDPSTAQINAEVLDVLNTDTFAELTAIPGGTTTITNMLRLIYALSRNKVTQTSTTFTLRNDADSGNIGTATVSDDGTTFIRSEIG